VHFRLPGLDERLAMISSYLDKYILHPPSGSKPIVAEGTTPPPSTHETHHTQTTIYCSHPYPRRSSPTHSLPPHHVLVHYVRAAGIDEGILRTVAAETEGYSGREISKLAIAWQAAAYGADPAKLTAELLLQVRLTACVKERERERVVGEQDTPCIWPFLTFLPHCFLGQVLRESKDSKGQKQMWLKREQADALTSDSK